MNNMKSVNWKLVSYMAILMIVCVCAFLVAKYIVRNSVAGEEPPIDTSTRIQ